jgi:hypothetical protein
MFHAGAPSSLRVFVGPKTHLLAPPFASRAIPDALFISRSELD